MHIHSRAGMPPQDYISQQSTRKCMFIFAHVFAGALLGLGFWHLTNDRRAVLICISGSIIPDIMDKPLGLLYPLVLGAGRTVFHSLLSFSILVCIIILLLFRQRLPGPTAGVPVAVLLHQFFDEMWQLPANWYYPLLGPFQGQMIPEYIGTFFWFEITNPSEWMFMIGSVLILADMNRWTDRIFLPSLPHRMKTGVYGVVVVLSFCIGLYLVATGLTSTTDTLITPLYRQLSNITAGILALSGAVIMGREMGKNSPLDAS